MRLQNNTIRTHCINSMVMSTQTPNSIIVPTLIVRNQLDNARSLDQRQVAMIRYHCFVHSYESRLIDYFEWIFINLELGIRFSVISEESQEYCVRMLKVLIMSDSDVDYLFFY